MIELRKMVLATMPAAAGFGMALAIGLLTIRASAADTTTTEDAQVTAFFKRHCLKCHGPEKSKGDLRIDQLENDLSSPRQFQRWNEIVSRVKAGEMPPEKEPKPNRTETATVVRRINARLDEAAARQRAEGRVVLRRLNRVEYENTVRDLFAVNIAVKEMLPEDTVANGFDNIGAALNVSPVLMERYLDAADAVLDAAIAPVHKLASKTERFGLLESLPSWFVRSVFPREDGVVLFRSGESATALDKFRASAAGRYRFRVSASAYQSDVPVTMAVLAGNFRVASGAARYVGYFDAPPGKPGIIEFETRLESTRETIKVLPASLPRVAVKPEQMTNYPGPGLQIHWIEAEGPFPEAWPSESYRRVFGDTDPKRGTLEDAEKVLRGLLPRAFRRPVPENEIKRYVGFVAKGLEAGQPFEAALRGGIKAVLASPQFIYLREKPGALDNFALASRLSYFLWSTMPDEALWEAASRGELRKPGVLHAQVERMLNHPRAKAFTENFTGQWLSLRDINFTTPDEKLYPEYDHVLQWSMLQETHLFFEEMLRHDLSVSNFVDSDFTMLNDRLGRHYGIPGVEGVGFRKVSLKPEQHRGGVLTHASVLKVTANGTTTSPVLRGVWVLDRILGKPAPPPPGNVPAIEPDIRGATTIREQLAKHRQTEACAACHARIDPPGFALENYDVIGGWRDHYRALGVKRNWGRNDPLSKFRMYPIYGEGPAVETGDTLHDGRSFTTTEEFKRLLAADSGQVARCVTEKLMTYATGQPVGYGDHLAINRILAEARKSNLGLRTLVHLVTESEPFQTK